MHYLNHLLIIALLAVSSMAWSMDDTEREAARSELQTVAQELDRFSRAFNLIHKVVGPSVVSVQIQRQYVQTNGFIQQSREVKLGEGSGFVFASDDDFSYIITNAHVVLQTNGQQNFIKRAGRPVPHDNIRIEAHDGHFFQAEYIGGDTKTDIAVLRINEARLPPIQWADSDKVKVGEWVVALGYPLGVGYSASAGIISATARDTGVYQRERGFESFIQTDAAINQGNSGGPLINLRGEVIGVNASILSKSDGNIGLGFAIPANLVKRVAEDIKEFGYFSFPMVGIDMREIRQDEADELGINNTKAVVIRIVFPGTPAAEAGLKSNDIILSVSNKTVQGMENVRTRLASARIGQPLPITIWRKGEVQEVNVIPVSGEEMISRIREHTSKRQIIDIKHYGLTVAKTEDQIGLSVSAIEAGGPAEAGGLRQGDRIYEIIGYGRISSAIEFEQISHATNAMLLRVIQKGHIKKVQIIRKGAILKP